MFYLFVFLFFITFILSFVYLFYKLKLLDDDIETLYTKYSDYISNSFNYNRGVNHD